MESLHKFLIVIGGPTASGKTSLSIELAQHFNAPILSCDSRQFYREMNIGTAKPDATELSQANHHFIGHISIEQRYTVGDYEREALELLSEIYTVHDIAILVGGSGLYQKAVCEGLDEFPEVRPEIKKLVEKHYQEYGIEGLQSWLQKIDPQYFKEVDLANPHRLMRAISVSESSGQAFSSFRSHKKKTRNFFPIYLEPFWNRALLYDRINLRVDLMMEAGLLEEARQLFPKKTLKALQTVGYQELFEYFDQNSTLEEAIELIKRNSRRYAKRQLTWSRRDGFWKHFPPKAITDVVNYLENVIDKQFFFQYDKADAEKSTLHLRQAKRSIVSCLIIEKKNFIYTNFQIDEQYSEKEIVRWFFHEISLRLQNNDLIVVPPDMQLYIQEFGLIAEGENKFRKRI